MYGNRLMKGGDALLGIGGTLVSISLPLLCFGDAAKREANVDYETFNLHFKSKIINPGPTSVKYNTMKKFLILFVTMITSIVALAQDLIVTTDSKKIEAKIIEISSDQVKYKEYDMPDGPTFVLSTKEISMIIFSSGKVILYEREAPKNTIVQQRSGNDFLYRTGNTYVYNGKQMRGKEYANFLKQYDIDAYNKYQHGHVVSTAGWILLGVGVGLDIGFSWWLPYSGYVGLACEIACIPTLIVGYVQKHQSVDIFNSSRNYSKQAYWTVTASQNGIGLALNF